MMWIRFLKQPFIDGQNTYKALITITTDLGDTFLTTDSTLVAIVRSGDPNGDIYLRKDFNWTAGMRCLPLSFELSKSDIDWPIRLQVAMKTSRLSDSFGRSPLNLSQLNVISAWSDIVNLADNIRTAKSLVERQFVPRNNRVISIWEETGDSIARHLWDAGVSLACYLDRLAALQVEAPPLLRDVLGSTSYKKLNVLELGSGCCLVGITLAQLIPNAEILLTDLQEAQEIAEKNISGMNPAMSSSARFQVLNWEFPLPTAAKDTQFDLILIADCTYNPDSGPALTRTLTALVKRSPKAIIVVAMKIRHPSERVFFDLMSRAQFVIGSQLSMPLPNDGTVVDVEKVDIYVFYHRDRPAFVRSAPVDSNRPVCMFRKE